MEKSCLAARRRQGNACLGRAMPNKLRISLGQYVTGIAAETAFADIQRQLNIEFILNIATDMKRPERGEHALQSV